MGVKELSDKGPDGTRLGQSSADLIGFWGATIGAKPVATTMAALTAGETTAANVAAAVVDLYTALKSRGLVT